MLGYSILDTRYSVPDTRHQKVWFILRSCQHDNGFIEKLLEIQVHSDERTQAHSTRSSLVVTHPSSLYWPRSTCQMKSIRWLGEDARMTTDQWRYHNSLYWPLTTDHWTQ